MARLLHPPSSRKRMLAVVIGYFDESGAEDKPVFSVAGFVAGAGRWSRFEHHWNKELDRYDVDAFHMTDFECREGEFRDKDWTNEERTEFIRQLAHHIKNTVAVGVGYSVIVDDFRAVFCPQATPREVVKWAYVVLFTACLTQLVKVMVPPLRGQRIGLVCEEREGVEGVTVDHVQRLKRGLRDWEKAFEGTPVFVPKGRFRPLEAADILAYEGYKHVTNQFLQDEALRPVRKMFTSLERTQRLFMGYFKRHQLEESRRHYRHLLPVEILGRDDGAA